MQMVVAITLLIVAISFQFINSNIMWIKTVLSTLGYIVSVTQALLIKLNLININMDLKLNWIFVISHLGIQIFILGRLQAVLISEFNDMNLLSKALNNIDKKLLSWIHSEDIITSSNRALRIGAIPLSVAILYAFIILLITKILNLA